ncbi:putative membrane protein YfcA [Pseudomonas sp. SORGH_AS199]|uniref:Probable membrane transporter protein n=1 Tax=Pseudomonas flavocrustae TaxID=2991719 RepID=A0ABT6IAD0_9PSED|nr:MULTISPECIES: sulfite exporter TauE/SafE family protein [Pseudomonas]MDH4761439.1 sulfite exporter TauE/SafE family protein [Pseudomonas sp. CBMAI 2609]MDR6231565.1 putative membrane protein YfcA [Pseudomonas sp. SORGH_AS_0199]QNQ96414.1 permease [Pseudomonas psychrotolerans]
MLETLAALIPAFSPIDWLFIEAIVVLAYLIFGVAGFGSALVAGPLLTSWMPLSRIVPLLVMLDFLASFHNWLPDRRAIAGRELGRLLPMLLLGAALGTYLLMRTDARLLMLWLGLFVVVYSTYSLLTPKGFRQLAPAWSIPAGGVGGLCGALFGSGGFLYALYLNGRLEDKNAIRGTQSFLIGCSASIRIVLLLIAGAYSDGRLLLLAVCLLPAMLLGGWIGRHLQRRLSRERFTRLVTWLVLVSGVTLIGRYLAG